jgi:signal transduction histidine kinase
MEELITDLLEISRIVNRPLTTTDISLAQVINDVLDTLEEILKNCTVCLDIQPNNLRLIANRAQITQCLQNIIGNSAKYQDPQKKPHIQITATADNDHIKISISDNGKGIAKEYQSKIFDIFERGDTDTQGNGVGLAIVKSVIEKHQGNITLVSEKNQGASFTLTLPRLKVQPQVR